MFRSTTTMREHVLYLAKVIFMLKHSLKLRRYTLRRVCCVLCTVHNTHTALRHAATPPRNTGSSKKMDGILNRSNLKKYWTDLHVSRLKMFRKV